MPSNISQNAGPGRELLGHPDMTAFGNLQHEETKVSFGVACLAIRMANPPILRRGHVSHIVNGVKWGPYGELG